MKGLNNSTLRQPKMIVFNVMVLLSLVTSLNFSCWLTRHWNQDLLAFRAMIFSLYYTFLLWLFFKLMLQGQTLVKVSFLKYNWNRLFMIFAVPLDLIGDYFLVYVGNCSPHRYMHQKELLCFFNIILALWPQLICWKINVYINSVK